MQYGSRQGGGVSSFVIILGTYLHSLSIDECQLSFSNVLSYLRTLSTDMSSLSLSNLTFLLTLSKDMFSLSPSNVKFFTYPQYRYVFP
jgi:hypothetical protein